MVRSAFKKTSHIGGTVDLHLFSVKAAEAAAVA